MPTLLVSLGSSPAIVPEAYLLPGEHFSEVHVLTTDSPSVKTDFIREWFVDQAPTVTLTITRVASFSDFTSEEDHVHFEEVLYRWYLEKASGTLPCVCIAGGFKTMAAAMQKAASILGAADVFHVLCDLPPAERPTTAGEIDAARAAGHLHWIRLGPESGWPQLRSIHPGDYPLSVNSQDSAGIRRVEAPDRRYCQRLRAVVERSHRIAGAWDRLSDLPFPVLATWSAADLAWLSEPVDPTTDRDWIQALPKVELHCHLGGFATHGEMLRQVRSAAQASDDLPPLVEPSLPSGWPEPMVNVTLTDYMHLGDATGSALLKDPGCLRRQCEMLYLHLRSQHVVHAEIRCSPANYATSGRSPWTVLSEIRHAFHGCMTSDPGCHVNLIIIATRRDRGDFRAAISRHLALAVSAAEHWTGPDGCRVVGVDLAGYEDITTRAHYFRDEFTAVHRCGLALTVHAGENDDAEGIWRAVFDLNARRIGHALHLVDSPELMQSMADRGIGVEMCPYANYQIKGFVPMSKVRDGGVPGLYPLRQYLERGIRVSVNTDNIGISGASLGDNLIFAARLCPGLTRIQILNLTAHAVDTSFLTPSGRAAVRAKIESGLPLPSGIRGGQEAHLR